MSDQPEPIAVSETVVVPKAPEAVEPAVIPRPFRAVDAVALALATALGVFGSWEVWKAKVRPVVSPPPVVRSTGGSGSVAAREGPRNVGEPAPPPPPEPASTILLRKVAFGSLLLLPPLAAWTLAVAGLRLMKPRGTVREVARHPGSLAALVAAAVLAAIGVASAVMLLMPVAMYGNSLGESYSGFAEQWGTVPLRLAAQAAKPAAIGVVIGWALLLLGRKGRRGRSWIEPAGIALGLLWIAGAVGVWHVSSSDAVPRRGEISLQGVER